MSYIAFDTGQIADIATATQAHRGEWDAIWNGVRAKLAGVVGEALDAATGLSLQERSMTYHRKSDLYSQQLVSHAQATAQIGQIAEQAGYAMVKTLGG